MYSSEEKLPEASVILVASAGVESISRVIDCLRAQNISDKLEIVLAGHAAAANELRRLPDAGFHSVQVVEADMSTSARARATAIRCSVGRILIFCEDHSFPIGPYWAEKIIEAHRLNHVAVGPVVRNANPKTVTSWANLVIEYGPWLHADQAGEVETIPGHNSSYKREVLLEYNDELGKMLEAEWVLHRDLRRKGKTLWLDPCIQVAHLNFSRFDKTFELRLLEGWMFAASRSSEWSLLRRLAYAASFPAIALVRFSRVCWQFFASREAAPYAFRSLPAALFFLLVDALGESIGYAFGDCRKRRALSEIEYKRWQNVRDDERSLALPSRDC